MYSAKVLDHFHNPRHVGEIENATAVVEASNPACGDLMKLWVVLRDGKITEAKFKVAGCVPAVACGSWLAEHLSGRIISDLGSVSADEIESALDGLPGASKHAAVLTSDVLRILLREIGR
ncbi:MAG: iron-sulfur cluster assembly scaffold protein [Acidobacteria bacterium]|nr:iron-sulfur cluster assembly scaffold protein [Acidobacteriota bacterium]